MSASIRAGHVMKVGLVTCCAVGLTAEVGLARQSEVDRQACPLPHVRSAGGDRRVVALLREAPRRSATLAALTAALDQADVVVWVDLQDSLPNRSGRLTLISAAHGYRYLALSLDARNLGDDRIGWLGHELTHALEVARAPEVQDASSMRRFFSRIACTKGPDGDFETSAAVDAGHVIRAEVSRTASTWRESGRRR
jgi:hypothetical protein